MHTTTVPQGVNGNVWGVILKMHACMHDVVANMHAHVMLKWSLVVEVFDHGGLTSVQWVVLIGLCVRIQRTPAKKSATSGGHNFCSVGPRMLCF